jgi:hypothetical protein
LERLLIDGIEVVDFVAIHVQYQRHRSMIECREHQFGLGAGITGDMTWKLADIRDKDGPFFFPCRSAHAFAKGDSSAGDGALEGAQN